MSRFVYIRTFQGLALGAALFSAACSAERTSAAAPPEPAPIAVRVAEVETRSIDRFLRVTGSIAADERAEVAPLIAHAVLIRPR